MVDQGNKTRNTFYSVVDAHREKKVIFTNEITHATISLYLDQDASDLKYEDIADIITYVQVKHGAKLDLVGGGYGCTELIFEVECESVVDTIKKIVEDNELVEMLRKRRITVRCIRSSLTFHSGADRSLPKSEKYAGAR